MKIFFAKIIFLAALFSASAIFLQSQTVCDISAQKSPLFLNLQTGMLPEQVQTVFGRELKIKIKKGGERVFFQNYIKNPAPASLRNVRALYLRFFDRKLYQIEIFYEPGVNISTLTNLIEVINAQFNLAENVWKIENRYAEAVCGNNSIKADNMLNPHIELTDEILRKIVEEKRKDKWIIFDSSYLKDTCLAAGLPVTLEQTGIARR